MEPRARPSLRFVTGRAPQLSWRRVLASATIAVLPTSPITVLLAGQGEPLAAALYAALENHGLVVGEVSADLRTTVRVVAPDLLVLAGDYAKDGGRLALDWLASDPSTAPVPVVVVAPSEALDSRLNAYRHGAVAVLPRSPSADAMATRIASLAHELVERTSVRQDLGEATLDDLVRLLKSELRAGLLRVTPKGGDENAPLRIVLGAGRPVADVVDEFVKKLSPLVSKAEPLVYELHQGPGGSVALLDGDLAGSRADKAIFADLRILVVDHDSGRSDALAQDLRAHGATVAITEESEAGLRRARMHDPDVIVVGPSGSSSFDVALHVRNDVRLRWAALVVVPWSDWMLPSGAPDLDRLAETIAPHVVPDRLLRERAANEPTFDTRLEVTGPTRLVRALAALPGPYRVEVSGSRASVEVDLAEGLIVGATAKGPEGRPVEGLQALALLIELSAGRVHVSKRTHPATTNVMSPVQQAFAMVAEESAAPSIPPPRGSGVPGPSSLASGRFPMQRGAQTVATPKAGRVAPSDLSWLEDSPDTATFAEVPTAMVEVPVVPPAAVRRGLPSGVMAAASASSRPPPGRAPRHASTLVFGSKAAPSSIPPAAAPKPSDRQLTARGLPAPKQSDVAFAPEQAAQTVQAFAPEQAVVTVQAFAPESSLGTVRQATSEARTGLPLVRMGARKTLPDTSPPPPAAHEEITRTTPTRELAQASSAPEAVVPIELDSLAPPAPAEPAYGGATVTRPHPALAPSHAALSLDLDALDPEGQDGRTSPSKPAFVDPRPAEALIEAPPDEHERFPAVLPVTEPFPVPRKRPNLTTLAVGGVLAGLGGGGLLWVLARPATSPTSVDGTPARPHHEASAEPTPEPAVGLAPPRVEIPVEPAPPVQTPAPALPEPHAAEAIPPEASTAEPPPDLATAPEALAERLVAQADGARDAAVREELYRRALAADSRNHYAMIGLARALLARGDAEGAIPLVEGAIRRRARRAPYRVLLGDAHQRAGNHAAARAAWEEALLIDPDDRTARTRLGR